MELYKGAFIFVFLVACIERIFSTFRHRGVGGEIRYRWATYIVICNYVVCILIALFEFIIKKNLNLAISAAGCLIAVAGLYLRNMSIKRLGDFWSIHIKVFDEQDAIENGTHNLRRRPYYVSVMLELVGVSLFFNSFLSLRYIFLVHIPLLLFRAFLEEKTLLAKGAS